MARTNRESFSLGRLFLQRAWFTESRGTFKANNSENGTPKFNNSENFGVSSSDESTSAANPSFSAKLEKTMPSCEICCFKELDSNPFYKLEICGHAFCHSCLVSYLKNEISESRTNIACPKCSSAIHPNNIYHLLNDFPDLVAKYEDFMMRRYLITDPDSRWCPAPNCSYAVIASGCASCPELKCERPSCGKSFCYHCKAEWHPDQTCDSARISREKHLHSTTLVYSVDNSKRDDIKPCPRCQILIVKMNDGSCNHMVCSVCGAEFCWLCMKEVSDLHYFSPSGCTFWGKKPWSRKKKLVWQIGTLIGAPVGIALLASIAVPSMVIGIPVWVGRKLINRYKTKSKRRRNISVSLGVIASVIVSPVLAGLAIAIGVPILLFYIYGVVPVSLCRAGCDGTSTFDDYKFGVNITEENKSNLNIDGLSRSVEISIGDLSEGAVSGSISEAMNSIYKKNAVQSFKGSTTALAGSIQNKILEDSDNVSAQSSNTIKSCDELSVTVNVLFS